MRLNFNKAGSLLLLLIVAMPFLFFLFSFCRQVCIQHEIKEKMELGSLKTVMVSADEFSWVREKKEVLIKGHLFDVHSYQQNGSTVSFTGLFDEDEDKIAENVQLFFSQKTQQAHRTESLSISFLFLPFYSSFVHPGVQPDWKFITSANQVFAGKLLTVLIVNITTPPPRACCSV